MIFLSYVKDEKNRVWSFFFIKTAKRDHSALSYKIPADQLSE